MNTQRNSRIPTKEEAIEIWLALLSGEYQHDIAARYGFNQGRVSEVKTRKRHPEAYTEAMKLVTKH